MSVHDIEYVATRRDVVHKNPQVQEFGGRDAYSTADQGKRRKTAITNKPTNKPTTLPVNKPSHAIAVPSPE